MKKLVLLGLVALASRAAQSQTVVTVAGNSASYLSPFNHTRANSAYEVLYLQNQLQQAGTITRLAFQKINGTDQNPLTKTVIYLKTSTATSFGSGSLDTTGYQRVWAGSFPNSGTSGWQEVALKQPFTYRNVDNLSVLVLRNNGNTVATPTGWGYATSKFRCRRDVDGTALTSTTPMSVDEVLADIRLTFSVVMANWTATPLLVDVYPNPATTGCRVLLPTRQPATYSLTDLLGRTVRPVGPLVAAASGTAYVPLADLPAGTYLLHLTQGDAILAQRLVKQ